MINPSPTPRDRRTVALLAELGSPNDSRRSAGRIVRLDLTDAGVTAHVAGFVPDAELEAALAAFHVDGISVADETVARVQAARRRSQAAEAYAAGEISSDELEAAGATDADVALADSAAGVDWAALHAEVAERERARATIDAGVPARPLDVALLLEELAALHHEAAEIGPRGEAAWEEYSRAGGDELASWNAFRAGIAFAARWAEATS